MKRTYAQFSIGGGNVENPRKTRLRVSQSAPGTHYTRDELTRIHEIIRQVMKDDDTHPTSAQISKMVEKIHRVIPFRSKNGIRKKIMAILHSIFPPRQIAQLTERLYQLRL